jgi:hypothetical protein
VFGDSKQASDTAFRELEDKDWQALENAWKAWVESSNFLKGR